MFLEKIITEIKNINVNSNKRFHKKKVRSVLKRITVMATKFKYNINSTHLWRLGFELLTVIIQDWFA